MSSKARAEEHHRRLNRPAALLLGLALLAPIAVPAQAAALGDLELRSYLGEQFDARIPVAINAGESMDLACFTLLQPEADGPAVTRAQLAVEREGERAYLRVQSNRPWNEPVATVRVRLYCTNTGPVTREYALLIDPRGAVSPPARENIRELPASRPTTTAPATASAAPVAAGQLRAVPGDTLASIAKAIYPRGRKVQRAFIDAIRASNPSLAALPENEPIPEGTEVALPDLRDFANTAKAVEAARLTEAAPAAPAAAATAPVSPPPAKAKAAPEKKPAAVAPPAPKPAAAPVSRPEAKPLRPPSLSPRAEGAFQLRLSTGDVDLSRSRGMDDEKRSKLRERQLLLDSDDQVAALLALRHNLKQLESQVAQLQLRLTSMPAASAPVPVPAAATPAKPAEAIKPVEVAKAPEPVAPVATPAPAPVPTPAQVTAATPVPEPAPPPKTEAAPPPALEAKAPEKAIKPVELKPVPVDNSSDELPAWLWGVVALIVLAIAWLILRLVRSRGEEVEHEIEPVQGPVSELDMEDSAAGVVDGEQADTNPEPEPEPARRPARVGEMTMQVAAYRPAPQMESDASLTTQVTMGDPDDLRRRYIEERFPELANRTISLDDTDSIVKGARLFYEDGAHSRAIELLTFAIEERPGAVKLWLALFEIYRLENMAGEFADLAGRFRHTHEKSEYWRKIQFIGREIDPQQPLYLDSAPYNSLETIGYTASRARDPRNSEFDPLAENWLNAPMDFMTDALASDLRRAVMAEHGLTDADIAPNPMPALKNVEVFGGN